MYRCSQCLNNIGLMADDKGQPRLFKCPYTGTVADLQHPIRRKLVAKKPLAEDDLALR